METHRPLLYRAWKRLIIAYLLSFAVSLMIGALLVKMGGAEPQALFEASTKRLSYAMPVLEKGTRLGLDLGVLLFAWNTAGALATLSFIYTATLFNPYHKDLAPRKVRRIFCGTTRMKLFNFLPDCRKIQDESLRRLYVWVMVPLLGMILLGAESGLTAATTTHLFGSFWVALVAFLPHGIIEIPAISLAGAVAYSAHLLIARPARSNRIGPVFQTIVAHRNAMPMKTIVMSVVACLLVAGWVEAHVTRQIVENLIGSGMGS